MTTPWTQPPPGLRERKKARTRAAIQDAALRLYIEQGYEATTVEQIAAAAEVSPSTFFRYFPTKAQTVLYDRLDPVWLESFVHQPPDLSPVAAIRAALHEVLKQLEPHEWELEQTRWRLVAEVSDLRSALADNVGPAVQMLVDAVAKRVGRKPDDFAVRIWTGALVGALYTAFVAATDDPDGDALQYLDACLAHLEAGLPL